MRFHTPPSERARTLGRAWLTSLARRQSRRVAVASGLWVLDAAVAVGVAFCALNALSALVQGQPPALWLIALAGGGLARAGLQATAQHWGGLAGAGAVIAARAELGDALVKARPGFSAQSASGALTSALIDEAESLAGYFARYAPLARAAFIGAGVCAVAAATIDLWAGVILLTACAAAPVGMAFAGIGAARAARGRLEALARLSARFGDRMTALPTLNLFNAAEREGAGLAAAADDFRIKTMAVLRAAFLSSAALDAAALAGLALVAGRAFAAPGLGLAEGAGLLILAIEAFAPLRRLSGAYHERQTATGAAQRLAEWLEDARAEARAPGAVRRLKTAPAVRFDAVRAGYAGAPGPSLAAIGFEAPAGRITALVGPTGSGKSTLLKVLIGHAELMGGGLRIDGQALAPGETLAGSTAWIGQTPRLFAASLAENIALGAANADPGRVRAAADAAGVSAVAEAMPGGRGPQVGEGGLGV
ncbi:MAG: ATP-binding cassette domain-containing protein, partial [Maricaulaceae bacterium]